MNFDSEFNNRLGSSVCRKKFMSHFEQTTLHVIINLDVHKYADELKY